LSKAGTTRVHLLAKELGVKSKSIVEKCQAEGLDIKNHMSTISVGLAATIREWFSEGEHATTVESSSRIDLTKVRVKKRKTAKKKVVEKPPEPEEIPEKIKEEPTAAETEAESAAKSDTDAEPDGDEIKAEKGPETTQPKPLKRAKRLIIKTKPVVPAGPQLEKPKPVELTGPKVIRIEKIEPKEPRRPKRPKGGYDRIKYDAPITEKLVVPDVAAPGKGGKKGKDKTRGRRKDHGQDKGLESEKKKTKTSEKRMRSRDLEERQARLAAARGETLRSRPTRKIEGKHKAETTERPEKATVTEPITVKDLSAALAVRTPEIVRKLMGQGIMATANQTISTEVAELVALEFGTELTVQLKQTILQQIEEEFQEYQRGSLQPRPPVVTMLGHVDHGKTSLLDRIRSEDVASGEAGGITQHIGAYQVSVGNRKITFLDTPGHEAFTAMRARGANMTDIVVLVIAADDGVMPQTAEAINHAKAAGVEIIIALNKIDLPGIDINRIYGQLAEHELTPSEWGGNVEIVKTSAETGEGIDDLIEHLDYIADVKEFKADDKMPASGWVIESKMTQGQGIVATVLVKEGRVNKGDVILAGGGYGRVRTMKNSMGKSIKKATSSMPVEVTGLNDVPQAGDKFYCLKDINRAKSAGEQNKANAREAALSKRSQVTLDNLFSQIEAGNIKELNIILKADVQGSVDVLMNYLTELNTDEVKVKILHSAVGGINDGDVVLAKASGAIIIGFNVAVDDHVNEAAKEAGVDIRLYNIIYRITEELKDAMVGLLDPEFKENQLGRCDVRNVFRVSSAGMVAGCHVTSGMITRTAKVRLIRGGIVINDNCTIESLKHFKDDVKEIKSGLECGIKLKGFDDIKIDDVLEAYELVTVARTL
jgi:translation initiation factor IF-2